MKKPAHALLYRENNRTGIQTIQDIVSTRAPAGDNNDPKKYAQDVAKWMGVSPNAILNLTDPRTMGALMQSMARKRRLFKLEQPAGVSGRRWQPITSRLL